MKIFYFILDNVILEDNSNSYVQISLFEW